MASKKKLRKQIKKLKADVENLLYVSDETARFMNEALDINKAMLDCIPLKYLDHYIDDRRDREAQKSSNIFDLNNIEDGLLETMFKDIAETPCAVVMDKDNAR